MFSYIDSIPYIPNYDNYSQNNIGINEKEQIELNKEDPNDKICLDIIDSFLEEINNIEYTENNIKKKRKIKKMKNYNIRKGDWQCKNCKNINFHFRTICNICHSNKK